MVRQTTESDKPARRASGDPRDHQVPTEKWDLQALPVLLVVRDPTAPMVQLDPPVQQVSTDVWVVMESLGYLDHRVRWDLRDPWVPLDRLEPRDPLVHKGRRENVVIRDVMDLRACAERPVIKAQWVDQVQEVPEVPQGQLEPRGLAVLMEPMEWSVHLVLLVLQAFLDSLAK